MFGILDINLKNNSISASNSSSRVAYTVDSTGMASGTFVEFKNASDTVIFVRSGDSTVTAATTDHPILPGEVAVYRKNATDTHYAAITASGSSKTIYAIVGGGV